jgi:hypothetical protein
METRVAMSRISPGRFPILLTLLAAAPAAAEQVPVDLDPIDQTIEDISVLSTSLREIEPGLQRPNDFSGVYRVRGGQDRFMRVQGGLYAVFPESVYEATREGRMKAIVPNDTMFYIGPPPLLDPESLPTAPPAGLVRGRIELRTDRHRAPAATPPGRLETRPRGQRVSRVTLPDIMSSELYRQRRVRSLMRRASVACTIRCVLCTQTAASCGRRCVPPIHAARGRSSSSK